MLVYRTSQGKIAAQGTPEDLIKSGVDFVARANDNTGPDKLVHGRRMSQNASRKSSIRSLYSRSSSIDESIYGDDDDAQSEFWSRLEESSKGKANDSIMMNYLKAGANWSMLVSLAISFLATQILASVADIWISIWFVFNKHCILLNFVLE